MDKKVFYNIINYRSYPEGTPVRTFTMDEFQRSESLIDSVNQILAKGCIQDDKVSRKALKTFRKQQTLAPDESLRLIVDNKRKSGAVSGHR